MNAREWLMKYHTIHDRVNLVKDAYRVIYGLLKDRDALEKRNRSLEFWAGVYRMFRNAHKSHRRALLERNRKLTEWIDMFTIDHLEGMFNHYMEMQKRAFHNQSGDSTVAFWHDRAKKQREIIIEFKALKLQAHLENLTTPTK